MRTSGIVSHTVLGARRLSTDPRPLTYGPADITFTGADGRKVDMSQNLPVLETASGEKVYPVGQEPLLKSWLGGTRVERAISWALRSGRSALRATITERRHGE